MFFRRKKKSNDNELYQPVMEKDGYLYVEEGQEYDQNQYETDSDYEDCEEEDESEDDMSEEDKEDGEDDDMSEEEEGEKEEGEDHDNNMDEWENRDDEAEKLEDIGGYDENEELIPWDDSVDDKDDDDDDEEEYMGNERGGEVQAKKNDDVTDPNYCSGNESNDTNRSNHELGNISDPTINEEIQQSNQDFDSNQDNSYGGDNNDEKAILESKDETNQTATQSNNIIYQNGQTNSHGNNNEDDQEEQPSTSLHEKRSLLALAAQHDRVDIIKTILQSTHYHQNINNDRNNNSAHQLIQLLLNNKIIVSSCNNDNTVTATAINESFTAEDIDPVFLPPLHIAIASSSTNAASCLLRMGSDPSIRTMIPEEWDGPTWDDPTTITTSSNSRDSKKKNNDVMVQHWRKLNGLSAWEIAFGVSSSRKIQQQPQQESMSTKGNDDNSRNEGGGSNKKRSWFSGWSSTSKDTSSSNNIDGPSFDISPSKLEGIKHAFTAEALRAIGSDEVHRLRELINSGLDVPWHDENNGNSTGSTNRGVEIGGKNLLAWCVEMNAEKCTTMLKEIYAQPCPSGNEGEVKKEVKETENDARVITTNTAEHEADANDTMIDGKEVSEECLLKLKIKLEENKVLASSLSLVLDNLAEEVSLTQGLLYQRDSSNTALISQVRSLKESRADIEIEISDWEGRLADRIVELRMVLTWWKNKGGSEHDFIEIFDISMSNNDTAITAQISTPPRTSTGGSDDHQSLRSRIMEMTAQVSLMEGKVNKLRSSISDLAEENSRNLIDVTKMGLGGAVSLARKLKDEVKEREHILQSLQQREAACRTRICMIRSQLEKDNAEVTVANNAPANGGADETNAEEGKGHVVDTVISGDVEHVTSANEESDVIYYDEVEDCIIEYIDDSDGSDVEYEYYSDDEEEKEEEEEYDGLRHSQAIKTGHSTALALKGEEHEFLSLKLWELFLRVIGLSKEAIKETVKSSGLNDINNLSRAMIV